MCLDTEAVVVGRCNMLGSGSRSATARICRRVFASNLWSNFTDQVGHQSSDCRQHDRCEKNGQYSERQNDYQTHWELWILWEQWTQEEADGAPCSPAQSDRDTHSKTR